RSWISRRPSRRSSVSRCPDATENPYRRLLVRLRDGTCRTLRVLLGRLTEMCPGNQLLRTDDGRLDTHFFSCFVQSDTHLFRSLVVDQSDRIAINGSTFAARIAGMRLAATATIANTSITAPSTNGSLGLTA